FDRCGIFLTINGTNFRGRTASDVVELRALFVDSDKGPIPLDKYTLPPHIRVRTPGGEHAFWLLQRGERLEDFNDAQKQLIRWFGTDVSINNLDRVMRLPGFAHCKGAPTLVDQVIYGDLSRRFTIAEVLRAYPAVRLVSPSRGAAAP